MAVLSGPQFDWSTVLPRPQESGRSQASWWSMDLAGMADLGLCRGVATANAGGITTAFLGL